MTPLCRICSSSDTRLSFLATNIHGRHLLSNQQFPVYLCHHCQGYFLDSVEHLPDYYSRFYPKDYYSHPGPISTFKMRLSFYHRLQLIKRSFPNKRSLSILDIGCGNGEFLNFLPDSFSKTGIDINRDIVNRGPNTIIADFNTYNFRSVRYDCITLWQVFEHLPDPISSLKKIHRLLKPNGLLLLDTPNSHSIGFLLGQKHYFHLDAPRHLFITNPPNITTILTSAGFSKISITNPITDYPQDLFWSVRRSPYLLLIYPFYPIFKLLNPQLLFVKANKSIS